AGRQEARARRRWTLRQGRGLVPEGRRARPLGPARGDRDGRAERGAPDRRTVGGLRVPDHEPEGHRPPSAEQVHAGSRRLGGGGAAGAVADGTSPLRGGTSRAAGGALALMLVAGARPAAAQPAASSSFAGRGPLETREEWLLAQPHLTLPALSPDTLPDGATSVRLDGDWGNDFGWRARFPGDLENLEFMIDGEHRTLGVEVRRGVTPSLTL